MERLLDALVRQEYQFICFFFFSELLNNELLKCAERTNELKGKEGRSK